MSGYALNKMVHEIQFPEKRARYEKDPEAFLAGYDLEEDELRAVREGDIRALWRMGVNPYLLRVYQMWNKISDDDFLSQLEGLSFLDSLRKESDHG